MTRRRNSKSKSGKISLAPTAKGKARAAVREKRAMKMIVAQDEQDKKMPLTAAERETVINMDSSCDYATIYTRQKKVMTRCKALGYEVIDHDDISYTFRCPLYSISFRSPIKCHRNRKGKPQSGDSEEVTDDE